MAKRKIIKKGDPTLNKRSRVVTGFDNHLHVLIDDMRETLLEAGGLGLAAPQVGILRRVALVIDQDENIIELVNPELVFQSGEQEGFEGCLSLPGKWGIVKRPMNVEVKAQDRFGNPFAVKGSEITARCFCHEIEHLDGHLFDEHTDRLYTEAEIDDMLEKQKEKGGAH